jgi:predicted metal-dependent peptidase
VIDPAVIEATKRRLNKSMFKMYQNFPFWAFLIEKCKIHIAPKESPLVSTAGIDKNANIYFNEQFIQTCSDDMLHFVLAHEVMHLLLGHFDRQGARDSKMWNVAGDILINHMLAQHFREKGISLNLNDACTADKFGVDVPDEATTEQIYDELMREVEKARKQADSMPKGAPDDLMPNNNSDPSEGTCIRENSESTPVTEKEWSETGLESATRARMAGNCPKFMERVVDALNNSKVPWNQVLAYYLRQKLCYNAKNRHTFTPPNRRYLYQDIILTSRIGTKKPSVAFCIDTSGSMSPKDLAEGMSELDAIRKLYKVPVYFMECDYDIASARWVSPYEEIPKVKGGGGTSFVPVMKHLTDNKIDVDALVFFTDGYGEFGNAPDFDVIWAINSNVKAPYGKTIRVGL